MSMQQTPLHYAACNYELDTVRFLVQEGCSVLAVDDRGRTAVDAIKVPRDARAFSTVRYFNCSVILYHFVAAGERWVFASQKQNKRVKNRPLS